MKWMLKAKSRVGFNVFYQQREEIMKYLFLEAKERNNTFSISLLRWILLLLIAAGFFMAPSVHSAAVMDKQSNTITYKVDGLASRVAPHSNLDVRTATGSVPAASCFSGDSYIDASLPDAHILRQAVTNAEKGTFHLFSHGRPGELLIDGQWLKKEAIMVFIDNKLIANSQKPTAIHIYGCNFARGEKGRAAVAYLEKELGISIAASTNLTGAEGDWELEVNTQAFNLLRPTKLHSSVGGSPLSFDAYSYNLQIDNVHYLPPFV